MYIINNLRNLLLHRKTKNIESILENKLQEFANLFPKFMQKEIFDKCYLAGGCIYSLHNNTKPKDWDIFCEDRFLLDNIRVYI